MSTIELKDLLDVCQAEALANKLNPTELSVYRSFCRTYSKKFNTPLCEVKLLPPRQVFLEIYEDQLNEVDLDEHAEDIIEAIRKLKDPNYEENEDQAIDDFIEKALKEEQERVAAGRPVHSSLKGEASLKNTLPEIPQAKSEISPTGGFIDLSYLESQDQS